MKTTKKICIVFSTTTIVTIAILSLSYVIGNFTYEGLPTLFGYSLMLLQILIGLAGLIYIILYFKKKKDKIIASFMFIFLLFLTVYVYSVFIFYTRLPDLQQKTRTEHQYLQSLQKLREYCNEDSITSMIFPDEEFGAIPISEVEFYCGKKSGVYDIWSDTLHIASFENCKNKIYNSIMRFLRIESRKKCF